MSILSSNAMEMLLEKMEELKNDIENRESKKTLQLKKKIKKLQKKLRKIREERQKMYLRDLATAMNGKWVLIQRSKRDQFLHIKITDSTMSIRSYTEKKTIQKDKIMIGEHRGAKWALVKSHAEKWRIVMSAWDEEPDGEQLGEPDLKETFYLDEHGRLVRESVYYGEESRELFRKFEEPKNELDFLVPMIFVISILINFSMLVNHFRSQ